MNAVQEKTGIELNSNLTVTVDWAALLGKILGAISDAARLSQGDAIAGAKSVVALYQAAGALKVETPIPAKALELMLLAFAMACDATGAPGKLGEIWLLSARAAITKFKTDVEDGKMSMPYDFFEQPTSSTAYVKLREHFVHEVLNRTASPALQDELVTKIDIAFRSSVWQLWTSRHPVFESLAAILNSPSAGATDFDRQWQSYKSKLVSDFHLQPVFGQEDTGVSLGSLYVPLRCTWSEKQVPSSAESGLSTTRVALNEDTMIQVRWLEEELLSWADEPQSIDWLRLIGGGPGSGKSTSAKALAATLALREDIRTLFIPLQRLDTQARLRDAINMYFTGRPGSPFQLPPLDRRQVENGPRLLLIFDGLDEIARPGDSANEIARDMIDRIRSLHSELTGDTVMGHKCLVTGRSVSFDAARKTADRKGRDAVEVIGYAPIGQHQTQYKGTEAVLRIDQRPQWWKRYSAALQRPSKVPEAFSDMRLLGVTSEPLLCYLLGISGYLEGNSDEAANNRNNVYQRLLSAVWERGWGGGRVGKGKSLSQDDFNHLFETMALAAWHGGDERVATFDRFEVALKISGSDEIYREFSATEGSDVSNLAVNFYLKQPDSSSKGFEFTHKSFGEYLTSRALFRIVRGVANIGDSRPEIGIADWLHGISDGKLSFELLYFLRGKSRLIASRDLEDAVKLKIALTKLLSRALREGFPAQTLPCANWRHAEDRQRRAEGLLLAMINSLAIGVHQHDTTRSRIAVEWVDRTSLGQLIHRLRGVRDQDIPEALIFSHISAPGAYLLGQELINFDLEYVEFDGAMISRAQLPGTRLVGANLRNVQFIQANLAEANFSGADLSNSSFDDVDATTTTFIGANFSGANLAYSHFGWASFTRAKFHETNVVGTDLSTIKLSIKQKKGINIARSDPKQTKIYAVKEETKVVRRSGSRGTSRGVPKAEKQ